MKILEKEKSPLDIFLEASSILNKAVEHTIGPNGLNTAVVTKEGRYDIINDGKTIIEGITSEDPALSPALETLKQASFETNRKAGDGTTSTTIIMDSLLQGTRKWMKDYSISGVTARLMLEDIKTKLTDQKMQNDSSLFYTTLLEIRKEAKIKWNDSELKKAYEDYMNNLIEKSKTQNS